MYIMETNSKSADVVDSIRIVENCSDYDGSVVDGNGGGEKRGALTEEELGVKRKEGDMASPEQVMSSQGGVITR